MTDNEKCREAFDKAGYWPNDVMWKAWQQAWAAALGSRNTQCGDSDVAAPKDLAEANEIIRHLRTELAAVAVAVGRSDQDGYDVDWFGLADDVKMINEALDALHAAPSAGHDDTEARHKAAMIVRENEIARLKRELAARDSAPSSNARGSVHPVVFELPDLDGPTPNVDALRGDNVEERAKAALHLARAFERLFWRERKSSHGLMGLLAEARRAPSSRELICYRKARCAACGAEAPDCYALTLQSPRPEAGANK